MVARARKAADYRERPSALPARATAEEDGLAAPDALELEAAASELASTDEEAIECRAAVVAAGQHGQRLDKVLVALAPEFSRSHIQKLVEDGHARVQGEAARVPARRVRAGDAVQLDLVPTEESRAFRPEPAMLASLAIVHEDEHLLVLDKPAGLVVHPAAGHWSGTLLNALLAHHAGAAALPRAGIVHRLDKDTSGLMLVGKTLPAVTALVRDIAARDVQRRYLALAWGDVPASLCIEAPIGRDPRSRLRMAVLPVARGGREARTDVECLARHEGVSALRCRLHTGRTHQIRVHLSCKGWPLVADALYGGRPGLGLARQALHAVRLQLRHPVTRAALSLHAPPPPDFAQAWSQVAGATMTPD
ncbi:MAG: RluA family pseudouridine synthase [Burkholderiales bacterium]|nr:RluA family pseudouridine synthase [Burkholderiales bacterium]